MPADLHESTIPGLLIAEHDEPFGRSVALNAEGDAVTISEFGEKHSAEVHVFTREGATWLHHGQPRSRMQRVLDRLRRLFGLKGSAAGSPRALDALVENSDQHLRDARDAFRA